MNDLNGVNRREFIKRSALAAAGFTIVPRAVLGGVGYVAPSDVLTKAIIGVGGMGLGHFDYGGTKLLAVCDVDAVHLKKALDIAGPDVKGYKDFRDVLARQDIDIVHIATPPHWHALIAIAAAEAGKDIWCEKPMTRTIGLLGWPLTATVSGVTGFDWKCYWSGQAHLPPQPVPEHLDYDFWLGPAPYKPYHPHRVHATFRGYWDYDGGGLGDMGMHYLDPVQYILGKDDTSPVRVEADCPQQHPDACGAWRRIELKYADGCTIILDGENRDKNAPFLAGPNGKLYPGFKSDIPNLEKILAAFPDPEPQVTDFSDAVRTRKKFALNEANGHRSCTLVNISKTAVQVGRPLQFDPIAQRFVNDDEANRFVNQPMRAPWRL